MGTTAGSYGHADKPKGKFYRVRPNRNIELIPGCASGSGYSGGGGTAEKPKGKFYRVCPNHNINPAD